MFGRRKSASPPQHQYPGAQETAATTQETPAQEIPAPAPSSSSAAPATPPDQGSGLARSELFRSIRAHVFSTINVGAAVMKEREQVRSDIERIVAEYSTRESLRITAQQQQEAIAELLNDMFGVGPIEPLLSDDSITDILVNGPDQIYVERHGRLELTQLTFRDEQHVINVSQRIAGHIGRRVDETSPMVDARLGDGSRVNIILPPLALRGACISIRKFSRRDFTLQHLAQQGSLSPAMARMLEVAAASRLNILISGGTGSGKTTLLNALSRMIDSRERIVTIEDAAELQLQQPHVVPLETRPENSEGRGKVTQTALVRNALRMRPDRIILGETRGAEAFDVLQAMNTGHDGSMTTIHANTPRDASTRLESMVMQANGNLPLMSIRRQIASAVQLIVQLERMRDGVRRVTQISEVVGIEGEIILMQDLFVFRHEAQQHTDMVRGRYETSGLKPAFAQRAAHFGLEQTLDEALRI